MRVVTPILLAALPLIARQEAEPPRVDVQDSKRIECDYGCQDDDPEFAAARKLLDSGHPAEAAAAFREIVEKDPENAHAWFLYAFSLHISHHDVPVGPERTAVLEKALTIHLRAANFAQYRALALYNAACACALLGRSDEAFDWLEEAFAEGFDRLGILSHDEDLASLRDDKRFKKYLPDEELFENGRFKGGVKALYTFVGENAGDQFGTEGRNAGDCDRDGKDDILLSAPYFKRDGAAAGRIYVYSGANGRLIFQRTGEPGEMLGVAVEAAGDVDADGFPDVIAGATFSGRRAGKAYVFSGKDGSTLLELSAHEDGDRFGYKVAGTGDLDDDGHADVIVGAPGSDEFGRDAGRAYAFSGKTGELLVALDGEKAGDEFGTCVAGASSGKRKLLATGAAGAGDLARGRVYVFQYANKDVSPHFTIEPDRTGVRLGGAFVSFVGDVDADGVLDVYASDWKNNAFGRGTGRVYVHSGETGARLLMLTGEGSGEGFGFGCGRAGDIDKDGHDDLIVGAWRANTGAPMAGRCTTYSGADGSKLGDIVCTVAGDTFGFDAVGMGDLDDDGLVDYLITAAWSSPNGKKSGRAYVIAGRR